MTDLAQAKPPALNEKRDTSIPSGWSYFGCVAESSDERLLQGFAFSSSTLSPLLCLTECEKLGYTWGGMEYGDEVSFKRHGNSCSLWLIRETTISAIAAMNGSGVAVATPPTLSAA